MEGEHSGRRTSKGRTDLVTVLRLTTLFGGLDDAHLRELAARGRLRSFGAGETIFLEGDRAAGFYVVLKGRAKVYKVSPKGREQILMVMGPGEPMGEVAVLSGESYPACAETLEPAEVLYIPRQAFLDLVSREPELAMRLLSALSSRLRTFTSLIEYLSLREVAERLAVYLLSLTESSAASQTVHLDMTKSQLSAAVGTVPETLSRAFQQLARAGAVETRGRRVHIKDRAALQRVAGMK